MRSLGFSPGVVGSGSFSLHGSRSRLCRPRHRDHLRRIRGCCQTVKAVAGLDDPTGQLWLTFAALFSASTTGIYLEKTQIGGHVSAPLITMLIAIILSNTGILPESSPVYDVTNRFLVPLAIPMLLFEANLRKVLRATGRMLIAFTIGLISTVIGTIVAWAVVPLGFGIDDWKIAAGLCARHIGGALNLVAVSEAVSTTPSVLTAVIAADNLAVFVYFMWLFFVSQRSVPPSKDMVDTKSENSEDENGTITVENFAMSISLSAVICMVSKVVSFLLPFPSGVISTSSVLVVFFVTLAPRLFTSLRAPGSLVGVFLLQVFFAASGATGSITTVLASAPQLLLWSGTQLVVHFLVLISLGRVFQIPSSLLFVASNANVGGPTTAAGMASSLKWKELIIPAILVGILGYATATVLSLALGAYLHQTAPTSGVLFSKLSTALRT